MDASRIVGVFLLICLLALPANAQAPGGAAGERARREAVAKGLDSLAGIWTPEAADRNHENACPSTVETRLMAKPATKTTSRMAMM